MSHTPEDFPIVIPCEYEDGISNRERRALRGPSVKERRDAARSAQKASGTRIRIYRRVVNQRDFGEQGKVWHAPVQDGIATRKSLGGFTLTVFDTAQQPLRYAEEYTEESLTELLQRKYPALFAATGRIAVAGTGLFGNEKEAPFIGLTFAHGALHDEKAAVKNIVAPELWLDDSHQLDDSPHVSLGQVFARQQAQEIQEMLAPVLPAYVQFAPGKVSVEHS